VYDVFARSFKRFRVVITIDSRLSTKKKARVDVQSRVSSEIDLDSKKKIALDSKSKMKMKNTTKRIAKRKKEEKRKKSENDELNDDDEKNDVDVRVVQIVVNKQFQVQIFVIIDKRSSSRFFVKK
jgi:hypothetical protein